MFPLIVPAVLAGMPAAYELDFRVLPAANTAPYYEYIIVLSFKGEPDVKIDTGIGIRTGPEEAADLFMDAVGDPRWKVKRNGERITVYGYDDVRIAKAAVEAKGPRPQVRRILLPPAQKAEKK
jgi:hypothetical protein